MSGVTVWLELTKDYDYVVRRNGGVEVHRMCRDFEWVTGLKLKPGQRARVKLSCDIVGKVFDPPPRQMILGDLYHDNPRPWYTTWPAVWMGQETDKQRLFASLYGVGDSVLRRAMESMPIFRPPPIQFINRLALGSSRQGGTITGRSPRLMMVDDPHIEVGERPSVVNVDLAATEERVGYVVYGHDYRRDMPEEGDW